MNNVVNNKSIIKKYIVILFIIQLIVWGLIYLPPVNLSQYNLKRPLNIEGMILMILFLTVLIKAQKESLKFNPGTSILDLTLVGIVICFISELLFQAIRQFTLTDNRLYYFIYSTLTVTALTSIISFFVAFQLKTKKTLVLVIMIVLFAIIWALLKPYLRAILF